MKIASFNVNSLRARLPIVLDWLGEHEPDVLCVQETKVTDVDFPGTAFDNTPYRYVFRGQKSYNGVAIFSKSTAQNVLYGFDDEPKDESRLITAVIKDVVVVNTYIPQGQSHESEQFGYKLNWFKRLRDFLEKHFTAIDRIVWVGDLNIAVEAKDVYDPEGLWGSVCFCDEVRRELAKVMDWGFIDVFRKHCDEAGQYTFWDYRLRGSVSRNLGWRLDHIMATASMADKSKSCYIDKGPRLADRPSDHTPIVAEFDL